MSVDLLIGGSPCQDLGVYKYGTTGVDGLNGKKSNLFYQFERAFEELNPKYFLLENVPMEKEWQDIISSILGVEPIIINSELVSAARRKRLYWTNIPGVTQPNKVDVVLKDICLDAEDVPKKYWYDADFTYNGSDKKVEATLHIAGHRNMKEVYNLNGKCNTLMRDGDGGNRQKKVFQNGRVRKLMPIEYERCMNIPDNYTDSLYDSRRYSAIGNGWDVAAISHIFSFIPESYLTSIVGLFDGISCGQLALNSANKSYKRYYGSEIDKYAIQVTMKNYPNTIQLGDVTKINWSEFSNNQ